MSPELADIVAKVPNCPALIFLLLKKSDRRPLIRVPSIALPRSSASLTLGDEVPHIFARKSRLKPGKFLIISAKRLLQQYRHDSDLAQCLLSVGYQMLSGLRSKESVLGAAGLSASRQGFSRPARMSVLDTPAHRCPPHQRVQWRVTSPGVDP